MPRGAASGIVCFIRADPETLDQFHEPCGGDKKDGEQHEALRVSAKKETARAEESGPDDDAAQSPSKDLLCNAVASGRDARLGAYA